jgi:AAA domain
VHGFYNLKEPILRDDPDFERATVLLKRLTACVCGDMAPAHFAALLRVLGTTNTKHAPPVKVVTVWATPGAHDLGDIEAMLDLREDAPLLSRREKARDERGDRGWNDPVDVDTRLADMQFKGEGASAIHPTQVSCTASLLRAGVSVEDATDTVLEATQRAAAGDPECADWDWDQERDAIWWMCVDFVNKNPELGCTLPDGLRQKFEEATRAGLRARVSRNGTGPHVRVYQNGTNGTARNQSEGPEAAQAPRRYKFPLVSFADLRPGTEPNYLVDELIPVAGLVVVYGAPKSGKSFWTFDLFMHVTLGWEYRDRAVQQGPVIYCAFEGAHGYRKRGEAFRRHHCLTDEKPPMYVIPGRADLIKEHKHLIQDMRDQLHDLGVTVPPRAVVLDTLNKSLIGSESKDVDMANYIAAAEGIQREFSCVVAIVHHHGIEESRPRGHTSLRGAMDAQIKIIRDDQNTIIAEIEDMRDGPEGAQIASRLVVVDVGEDVTGKTLTSAAVEPVDGYSEPQRRRRPKLTKNQQTMLSLLEEGGPQGLPWDEWSARAREAGLAKNRPATLRDLRADLAKKGLVVERNGTWVATDLDPRQDLLV